MVISRFIIVNAVDPYVIHTDSESFLLLVVPRFLQLLHSKLGRFCCVPSHVSIQGNDWTDREATRCSVSKYLPLLFRFKFVRCGDFTSFLGVHQRWQQLLWTAMSIDTELYIIKSTLTPWTSSCHCNHH